ncbi:hypothetical protein N0P70_005892 [Klebsiella michiganensis]|nr:hypothetical protein [Klebsiella michiganensis]
MISELDARLRVDENGVIISTEDKDTWMARLDEWLRTPMGSVYGLPHWGSPMEEFKHEPIGSDTSYVLEVAIEGRLLEKLDADLPGLNIQAVRCQSSGVDILVISFYAPGGKQMTVQMNHN